MTSVARSAARLAARATALASTTLWEIADMAKVLIDRELLERAASMELDTTTRSICIQDELRAILAQPAQPAQPAQQSEAVEVAQVVSYLSACADGYDPDAPHPGPPEPLMTVAQHNRILAAALSALAASTGQEGGKA